VARLWWLVALAVGLPVVVFNYLLHANLGTAMSLIFTFVAGGVGAAVGRAVGPAESPSQR